jgi:hypothetical protein
MQVIIRDKLKRDTLIGIIQLLKQSTQILPMSFSATNGMSMNGYDSSNVCVYDVQLYPTWFDDYVWMSTLPMIQIGVSTDVMLSALQSGNPNQHLIINYNTDEDHIFVSWVKDTPPTADANCSGEPVVLSSAGVTGKHAYNFDKYYTLKLSEFESANVPVDMIRDSTNSEADICISSKHAYDLIRELDAAGHNLQITCFENGVDWTVDEGNSRLKIVTHINELDEYSVVGESTCSDFITEADELNSQSSTLSGAPLVRSCLRLHYLLKYCLSPKIANEVCIYVTSTGPARVQYSIHASGMRNDGPELGLVIFMIAPIMQDV